MFPFFMYKAQGINVDMTWCMYKHLLAPADVQRRRIAEHVCVHLSTEPQEMAFFAVEDFVEDQTKNKCQHACVRGEMMMPSVYHHRYT